MMKKTFCLLCVTLLFSTLSAEVSILSENASYPDFAHLLPWSINVKSFGRGGGRPGCSRAAGLDVHTLLSLHA